jgi:3-oxoacyl-(acyl-carrier-protein) synthase
VLSSFSPLVAEAADRCLRQVYGKPPAPPDTGRSTAIIVVSASGDMVSARHVARTVDSGRRVAPLFFFQCVPNSIAGHIAARWGLGGPVVCLCPTGHPLTDGLDQAALLIDDGDATAAVIVLVEQSEVDGVPATATAVLTKGKETHVRQEKVADEHLRY